MTKPLKSDAVHIWLMTCALAGVITLLGACTETQASLKAFDAAQLEVVTNAANDALAVEKRGFCWTPYAIFVQDSAKAPADGDAAVLVCGKVTVSAMSPNQSAIAPAK